MRTGWAASILAALAGLVVLGGATAPWVVETQTRQIGGVEIPEVATVTGAELRPLLVLAGVTLLLSAVPMGLARGVVRRVVGVLTGAAGAGAVGLAALAIVDARSLPGELQPVAWLVVVGGVGGIVAGVLAIRRPARGAQLPSRFEVPAPGGARGRDAAEEQPSGPLHPEDEWRLASEEPPDPAPADPVPPNGLGGREPAPDAPPRDEPPPAEPPAGEPARDRRPD